MADGKKIEIKIAATGGDQAAAEIRKVTAAADDASNPANQRGFGGMLDGVPERAEEVADSMGEVAEAIRQVDAAAVPLSEHLGEAKDNLADIGEESENASRKLDKIANIQRAQVAAQLAQGLGMIGDKIKESAEKFKEADPEFAATLENLAFGLDSASSAANLAAQGFAVGGPFGAAIGALVGVALPSLKSALDDMTSSLANLAASEAQAAEMAQRLAEAQNGGMEAALDAAEASEKLTEFYTSETEAIDKLIGSMERRNKLLDANNKADKAAADRSDATRIRNGEDPETVKQERVAADEAAALAAVDKGVADKRTGLRETKNAAIKAEGELGGLRVNGQATPEQIAEAEKIVAELQERLAKIEAAVADAEALAGPKKREIRETAAGKGEALAAQRRDRKEAEAQRAAEQQAAAADKAEKAAADAARTAGRDNLTGKESALDRNAKDKAKEIFDGGTKNSTARGVATALENGTNEEEIAKLTRMVNEKSGSMGAAMTQALREVLAGLEKQAGEISVLRSQIKTNRTGQ